MIKQDWKPDWMELTEIQEDKAAIPSDGHVSAQDAERLMVACQWLSEQWAQHFSNATFYKENAKFKRDAAYNLAFLKSEGKSDRQRDVDARNDPLVRSAEAQLILGIASLKHAELKYDGAVRGYHAYKKILEVAQEEKQWL